MKGIELRFFTAVAKNPQDPKDAEWTEHRVKLPRLAAVELGRMMYAFVPDDREQPVMFALHDSFLDQLTAAERIRIECVPDHPGVARRLRRSDGERPRG